MSELPPLLRRLFSGRTIEVFVNESLEQRLRMDIDRYNRIDPDDPMNPDDDGDLAVALLAAADGGLSRNEKAAGLATTIFGDVVSAEVMDEGVRRRRARRRAELGGQQGEPPKDDPA